MRYLLLALTLSSLLFSRPSLALVPFSLSDIWSIPQNKVTATTKRTYTIKGVEVEEVFYESRPYKGKPVKIFGYYCYPVNRQGKLPAILLVHGGGGSAHLGRTLAWAQRGYALLTIDLPGHGEQRKTSRSTGPDMDVPILLRTKPSPDYNYLVHAVAATRNGISYLTSRDEVDKTRIGMVGLSWGGVITLLTNGQDDRLKTAVNIFGAGFIPEGCTWQDHFDKMSQEELETWNNIIDPKNFLATQHAPILFISGTNDHCYYLPTFQKSYEKISSAKNLYLVPNLRHRFLSDTQSVVWRWLDCRLKDKGNFPQITAQPAFLKQGTRIILSLTIEAKAGLADLTLQYTQGEPSKWTQRKWLTMKPAYEQSGTYYFSLPVAIIKPELMFFIIARDKKGAAVSTPVRSIFPVYNNKTEEVYALTKVIEQVNLHGLPSQFVGLTIPPLRFRIYFSKKEKKYYLINLEGNEAKPGQP
ncbi:hypothetical protein COT42_06585 [Candidatus Saganbacteria bacterium CG08_land_8_20_14_0_20_45_16]|uniref:Acetyl xylan esterase domain-containing protein n=1 Tax=Candidatus Saganbacteria bacterium CG08_land_8_20_14_0_20_45_16 TaxID=2014293 RepID=A0A2H0XVM2_UNCSA|nr:MAG: hypothetical protein COT42_06585 [Candidatus Saganbacteria bacterium CG08_land_8_20_14_0_20_45_16]